MEEVSSEEVVYLSMIEWIKHDVNSRREYVDKLFSCIDVDKLSWSFHTDVVQKEDFIMDSKKCLKRCLSAKTRMGPMLGERKCGFVAVKGKKVFRYDIESKRLIDLPDLSFDIDLGTAVNFSDELYVISGNKSVAKLDLTDSMSEWVDVACTNEKRYNAAATVCGDFIYVVGGGCLNPLSSAERFDHRKNAWYNIKNMNSTRYDHAMVSAGGMLWAVGGYCGRRLNTVECFNTRQDTWNRAPSMKYKRSYLAAVVLDCELYAIGGLNNLLQKLASVERCNLFERTWCDVADLNQPRSEHGACVVNGKIYVAGGNSENVEVYDPNENVWKVEAETEALKDVSCIVSTYQ